MIDLRNIDLNLLVAFREIVLTRSVSAAAQRLDVTQSALSNALNRLRKTLNDELFVRTADGMAATPFALTLVEPVDSALELLRTALNRPESFQSKSSQRTFALLMTDVGEVYLMPRLVNHCMTAAPQVGIKTVRAGTVDMLSELAAGRVDLAIGAFGEIPQSLRSTPLFTQGYLTIFRKGHPLAKAESLSDGFRAAKHLVIDNPASPYREVNAVLQRAGLSEGTAYRVPHVVAVPYIVSKTNLVVTVPQKLAEQACQAFGLDSVRPPWRLPKLRTDLVWHARFDDDAGNLWLRKEILTLFGNTTPDNPSLAT